MSNLERDPSETPVGGIAVAARPEERERLEPREVPLGGPRAMLVRRTLPHRDRRTVGAWCFVDSYGPHEVGVGPGMQVPPHPHTGLQTVSWLLDGDVLHRDSLGSVQLIRPGQLNLMTAGRGISHSEESPAERSPRLHGVQLWVALPDPYRHVDPWFTHHAELPVSTDAGVTVTVIMGAYEGLASPARTYSPIVGAEIRMRAGSRSRLRLEPEFEHAVLALSAGLTVDGDEVPHGSMTVLGPGRRGVDVGADRAGCGLLLGGEPLAEELLMWWNFVGRTHEEIVEARSDWEEGRRFGTVRGYDGEPLRAPALPGTPLRPRPRVRGPRAQPPSEPSASS